MGEARDTDFENRLEDALLEWSKLLEPQNIETSQLFLERFVQNCGFCAFTPSAIIRPSSASEVPELVRVASRFGIPLYPISAGMNLGYGGASPYQQGNVLLDLRSLASIEVNEEMAYAVIEPGVTQSQLQDALQLGGDKFVMDASGAPPEASLVGNILERGHGHSRYGWRSAHYAGMEVVLADGRLLRTGLGRFSNANCANLYREGLGPSLDGLFSQSNFGIVLKMAVWLMPRPEYLCMYTIEAQSDEQAGRAVEILAELKRKGVVDTTAHFLNEMRLLGISQRYPFEWAKSSRSLSGVERKRLRERTGTALWTCVACIDGNPEIVRARLRAIKKAFRGVAKVQSLSESQYSFRSKVPGLSKRPQMLRARALFDLFRGRVSDVPLRGAYWRKDSEVSSVPPQPMKDGCGLRWCSPVIPATQKDFSRLVTLVRDVCCAFEFDANLSVNLVNERAACCVIGVVFNKSDKQETARAQDCFQTMMREVIRAGYPPYRIGAGEEELNAELFPKNDPHTLLVAELKKLLDPKGILAPGKYGMV